MRAGQQAPVCLGSRKRELHSPPPHHPHLHRKACIGLGLLVWVPYGPLGPGWLSQLSCSPPAMPWVPSPNAATGVGLSVFLVLAEMLLDPAPAGPTGSRPGQGSDSTADLQEEGSLQDSHALLGSSVPEGWA